MAFLVLFRAYEVWLSGGKGGGDPVGCRIIPWRTSPWEPGVEGTQRPRPSYLSRKTEFELLFIYVEGWWARGQFVMTRTLDGLSVRLRAVEERIISGPDTSIWRSPPVKAPPLIGRLGF